MTNRERFNEIVGDKIDNIAVNKSNGIPCSRDTIHCLECLFMSSSDCAEEASEWLEAEVEMKKPESNANNNLSDYTAVLDNTIWNLRLTPEQVRVFQWLKTNRYCTEFEPSNAFIQI